MKKRFRRLAALLCLAVVVCMVLAACGGGGAKDAISGTWKQTDEINGNWEWTFDGGKCKLVGETTGFEGEGTYTLDETAKKVTITVDGWENPIEYTYTLDGNNLSLDSDYSSYKLVKQ